MPSMNDLSSENYINNNAYSFHGVVWTGANSVSFSGKVNWNSLCRQLVIMQLEYAILTLTETR